MKNKVFIITILIVLTFLICSNCTFNNRIKIVKRIIVPQGRDLYIKDTSSNSIEEKTVDGFTVTYFLGTYKNKLLYASFDLLGSFGRNKIFSYDPLEFKTTLFYSLDNNMARPIFAKWLEQENILLLLYEIDERHILRAVDMRSNNIVAEQVVDDNFSFIDANEGIIILSSAYEDIFDFNGTPYNKELELATSILGLTGAGGKPLRISAFNLIFGPSSSEVFAIDINKNLLSYDLGTNKIRIIGLKCKYAKWIRGTNSLLVVVPKFSPIIGDFSDIGIYDLNLDKYTRVMGGYKAVDRAFYQ